MEILHVLDSPDDRGHLLRVEQRMRERVSRAREHVPGALALAA